jgi:hypothetical protein
MTKVDLLETTDHWLLPLAGEVVVQCRYDYAFTLVIGESDPPFIIRISEKFTIQNPGSEVETFDPEEEPQRMCGTLRLLRGTVTHSIARKDGRLEIAFEDGTSLRVSPSSDYEPWELSGPNGLLIVANTDGGLVVWR